MGASEMDVMTQLQAIFILGWAGVYRDFLSQVNYDHRSYALYDCFLDSVMVSTYCMLGQSLS